MTRRAAAQRYARALFDVGRAQGEDLERIGRELADLAALVTGHDQLGRVFGNPAIPAARKRAIVEALLERSPLVAVLQRTLLLLADRDRLVLIGELAAAYRARLLDHLNVVQAEVTTAMPLPPDRATALQQQLATVTGREVHLAVNVNPAILGGAIARVGSTVFDGSVTTQLEKLKQRLVEAGV